MHTTVAVDVAGLAIDRLQAYFVGVPDARLTVAEVSRLCGVNDHLCRQVVAALVDIRFLARECDGSYTRQSPLFSDEPVPNSGLTRRLGWPYVGR